MLFPVVNFLKCVVTEVALFSIVAFKTLDISQGSVATHLGFGGVFSNSVITIFSWFWYEIILENRLIFGNVKAYKITVPNFLGHPVDCIAFVGSDSSDGDAVAATQRPSGRSVRRLRRQRQQRLSRPAERPDRRHAQRLRSTLENVAVLSRFRRASGLWSLRCEFSRRDHDFRSKPVRVFDAGLKGLQTKTLRIPVMSRKVLLSPHYKCRA